MTHKTENTRETVVCEKKEPPPELMATMGEMNALLTGEPTFHDLRQPWLSAPK